MKYPSLEELVNAGVHFGHLTARWNPKMEPFIFTTRNKVHIINLEKTLEQLKKATEFAKDVVAGGGTVLFVGTKRQAKSAVKAAAERCGMPYVTVRWLGGTFTNFKTIQRTVRKLESRHKLKESEDFTKKYTKKERLMIEREIEKMESLFSGIKNMKKIPEAIFVVSTNHDKIAVREAKATGVKVIGLVDTNSDIDMVDYPITSNDDAIKAITLMVNLMADAVTEGQSAPKTVAQEADSKTSKTKSNGK